MSWRSHHLLPLVAEAAGRQDQSNLLPLQLNLSGHVHSEFIAHELAVRGWATIPALLLLPGAIGATIIWCIHLVGGDT